MQPAVLGFSRADLAAQKIIHHDGRRPPQVLEANSTKRTGIVVLFPSYSIQFRHRLVRGTGSRVLHRTDSENLSLETEREVRPGNILLIVQC